VRSTSRESRRDLRTLRGPFRFASPPLILLARAEGGGPGFDITVHLTRRIDPTHVVIHLNGAFEPEPPSIVDAKRHCYEFGFTPSRLNDPPDPDSLLHPEIGDLLDLEIEIQGHPHGDLEARVPLAGPYPLQIGAQRLINRLTGCN
jgi:hypothetical protein